MIDAINQACYDAQPDRWLRFPFEEFLPAWVEKYAPGAASALEIGSGNGKFAEWLLGKGCDVLCLEPSVEMARRTRARGLKVIETTVQNYHGAESFDLVSAICSLIHVPKKDFPAEIDKIAKRLRPKSTFLLAMIEGTTEGLQEEETGFPRFFATYTQEELWPILQDRFELLDFRRVCRPDSGRSYLVYALNRRREAASRDG